MTLELVLKVEELTEEDVTMEEVVLVFAFAFAFAFVLVLAFCICGACA